MLLYISLRFRDVRAGGSAIIALLHDVLVVLVSTAFFLVFGIENWRIMALIWAALPAAVGVMFCFAPVNHLIGEGEKGMTWKELTKSKLFWVMVLMMICAGASENGVVLWSSTFAEKGIWMRAFAKPDTCSTSTSVPSSKTSSRWRMWSFPAQAQMRSANF